MKMRYLNSVCHRHLSYLDVYNASNISKTTGVLQMKKFLKTMGIGLASIGAGYLIWLIISGLCVAINVPMPPLWLMIIPMLGVGYWLNSKYRTWID